MTTQLKFVPLITLIRHSAKQDEFIVQKCLHYKPLVKKKDDGSYIPVRKYENPYKLISFKTFLEKLVSEKDNFQ
jgi:hypothetical protein